MNSSIQHSIFIYKYQSVAKLFIPTQKGFILLSALFFLCITTLLTLALLSTLLLALRMSQNASFIAQQFYATEAGLRMAESQLTTFSTITSGATKINYGGCLLSYHIEPFNIFCIRHTLSTLVHIISKTQCRGGILTLQTTYMVKGEKTCDKEESQFKIGRNSWRQLKNYSFNQNLLS